MAREARAGAAVSGQVRLTVWVVAGVVVLIGTRGVLTGRLPAVGQFVPFPGWSADPRPSSPPAGIPSGCRDDRSGGPGPAARPAWSARSWSGPWV